jgi:arsenate reductase-like glutaredoxin family protein
MKATIINGTSSLSTKKAKEWFVKNKIPYVERNVAKDPITLSELQKILRMTVDGTDEIIAKRSKVYKELNYFNRILVYLKRLLLWMKKDFKLAIMKMKFASLSQEKLVKNNG